MKSSLRTALALLVAGTAAFADGTHTGAVQRTQSHDGGSYFFKLANQSADEWFFIDGGWSGAKVMISNLLTAKSMGLTVKVIHRDASIWHVPAQNERYREVKTLEVE